jgi:protein O-GlcNAc transferase
MAGSALTALGLTELVTGSLAEYEATALALARDSARLGALRERLERARREHPFFQTDRYRADLEAAYATMLSRHTAGLPPASFTVGAGPVGSEAPLAARQAAGAAGSSLSNGPT